MTDALLQGVTFAAVVIIIILCEMRINRMTMQSRPWFVVAFILIAGACLWEAMQILSWHVPDMATACAAVGLATLLIEERKCPRSCARMNEHAHGAEHKSRRHGITSIV